MKVRFGPGKITFRVSPAESFALLDDDVLSVKFNIPEFESSDESSLEFELKLTELETPEKMEIKKSGKTIRLYADKSTFEDVYRHYPKQSVIYLESSELSLKVSLEIDFKGGKKVND